MMQFSEILTAIHDAWMFAWPPLVLFTIAYLIAYFFNASATRAFFYQIVGSTKAQSARLGSLRTVLEPYGLNKLIPVISLVLVIGFMYLLNGPLTIAVSNLPPHLSYRPDLLIGRNMSDSERLLLIRKYPTVAAFNDAFYMALEGAKSEAKASTSDNQVEIWYKMQNFLKFSILFSVIMFFINFKQRADFGMRLFKLILITMMIGGLWAVSLAGLLYQQEQQFYREWRPIKFSLQKDAMTVLVIPASETEMGKIIIDDEDRWWKLYFINPSRMRWIDRTFFE